MRIKSITLGFKRFKISDLIHYRITSESHMLFCSSKIWNILKKIPTAALPICFSLFKSPIEKCCRNFVLTCGGPTISCHTQLGGHSLWVILFWNCPAEMHVLIFGFSSCFISRSHVLKFVAIQAVSEYETSK